MIFIAMKYIISEQRFERLVNKYLNTLDFMDDNHNEDGFAVIYNGSEAMAYRNRHKKLYISTDLIKDMKSIFNLSQKEVMDYVRMWFHNEYDVEVKTLWFLFPDEPFTY
jgi:hypothetical protein